MACVFARFWTFALAALPPLPAVITPIYPLPPSLPGALRRGAGQPAMKALRRPCPQRMVPRTTLRLEVRKLANCSSALCLSSALKQGRPAHAEVAPLSLRVGMHVCAACIAWSPRFVAKDCIMQRCEERPAVRVCVPALQLWPLACKLVEVGSATLQGQLRQRQAVPRAVCTSCWPFTRLHACGRAQVLAVVAPPSLPQRALQLAAGLGRALRCAAV